MQNVEKDRLRVRIIRRREVLRIVGLGHTQLDEAIRRGEFPPPVKITESGRAIGWPSDEIDEHIAARKAARVKRA